MKVDGGDHTDLFHEAAVAALTSGSVLDDESALVGPADLADAGTLHWGEMPTTDKPDERR